MESISRKTAAGAGNNVMGDPLSEIDRYKYFIRNSSQGIWRFELDKPVSTKIPPKKQVKLFYKYAYLAEANQAMADFRGLRTPQKMTGLRISELFSDRDQTLEELLIAFIKSSYKLSGIVSQDVAADGRERTYISSLVGYIYDDKLIGAWGTRIDFTEHYETVKKLRKMEEHLNLVLKSTKTGLWELDPSTNKFLWTKELEQLFGFDPNKNLKTSKYLEATHPQDIPEIQKLLGNTVKDGHEHVVEHRTKDGAAYRWLLSRGQAVLKNGKVERVVGITMDIDKRKKAEIEAQESETRFRVMADTAPVLIWVADADRNLIYFNKPWHNFTGKKCAGDLNDCWRDVIHPDDYSHYVMMFNSAFENREPFHLEYRLRRYDKKYLWMLDKGVPRYTQRGQFMGYIGIMVEVEEIKTTRKRQRELEEVNRKLKQQSEQLIEISDAKDEFISLASHQLRTPATGVKQYIGMVLEGYSGKLTSEQTTMLQTAYESNERQLRIIDDLLKIAHIDAARVVLARESTDIIKLIGEILREQSDNFAKHNQNITLTTKHRKVTADIDRDQIRMALDNIIDNAGKYTREGKNINISVSRTASYVTITVTDEGVGIAKRDLPKLFKKFSRIDNVLSGRVGGSGLGLYWANKIIDLHGGKIVVQSKLRKGTSFIIKLPRK